MSSPAYTVAVSRSAQKEIKGLDATVRPRVLQALRDLGHDARPAGCRKLVGAHNRWRVRVGDYRIIYAINDSVRLVEVVTVRHRSKAHE